MRLISSLAAGALLQLLDVLLSMGHDEAMTSSFGSNPEDEYADDEYADDDAEDREEPSVLEQIPDDEPEADVLEQRAEVSDDEDEDEDGGL